MSDNFDPKKQYNLTVDHLRELFALDADTGILTHEDFELAELISNEARRKFHGDFARAV